MSAPAEPLREVIARHGLSASKSLGQNFILDRQLLARVAAVPGPLVGKRVYEVGPGPGGLTRALLDAGASVVAVERDQRCIPALGELQQAFGDRLSIIEGDALRIDETAVVGAGAEKGPGEPDKTFSGIGSGAGTVAGGNCDQVGVQGMFDDIAGVEFVGVGFRREDDGGFERASTAGSAVSGEVKIGKFFGLAGEEGVVIVLAGRLVPFPGAAAEDAQPVVRGSP